jgi:circadian clock protein KaiC
VTEFDRSPLTPGDELPKSPTGIQGFDEITGGGLPKGRPTLVCGSAGSGKTLFAVSFLVDPACLISALGGAGDTTLTR